MDDSVQTVEIIKQPGQTLGFYIREGNGIDRWSGVFVSRIAQGSVVAKNNLLRVNDEIMSVNTIDVQRMSLDDVVILMSIAKRLVLTIRINKNSKLPSHLDHAEVISPREQAVREGRQPVVVLKSGFKTSSFNDMSVDEQMQERFLAAGNYLNPNNDRQLLIPSREIPELYGTLPCYNVPYINQSSIQSLSPRQVVIGPQQGNIHYSQPISNFSPSRIPQYYQAEIAPENEILYNQQIVQSHFPQHRGTGSDQFFELGYRPNEWLDARTNLNETDRLGSGQTLDRASMLGNSRLAQHTRILPNGRICQTDQYNSDSEVTPRYQKSRNRYRTYTQMVPVSNDIERNQMLMNSMTLSRASSLVRNRTSGSFADLSSLGLYGEPQFGPIGQRSISIPYQTINSNVVSQDNYGLWLNQQMLKYGKELPSVQNVVNPVPSQYSLQQRVQPQFQNYRLTRKLSTDSLLDYKTYKMDEPMDYATYQKGDNRLGSWISSDTPFSSKSSRTFSNIRHRSNLPTQSKTKSQPTSSAINMTVNPYSQTNSKSSNPSPSTVPKLKSNQLSRMPIKIQTEQFLNCPGPDLPPNITALTGKVKINVMCGHGLKSTKTALRDLYCVIEVDSMPVARTMVRTGALNFDWDEIFEFDIVKTHKLQFLIYSWDPDTRHQLCFTTTVPISYVVATHIKDGNNYLKSSPPIKLAIKLDPKGTLYTELTFVNICQTLQRQKSNKKNSLFGVDLKEIVQREKSGSNVPLLLQRCVREIEKRGVGQLGLYRLSGSLKRKQQLIEEFEKNVRLVDLSPEGVSDVNVFTSVLKDFFRELPEPLCSNSLHEMLLDALSVQMPGDVEGNTQLMLGILECLPRINQDTLAFMLNHLKRVSNKSDVNKMTTYQLGLCLGPSLICPAISANDANMHNIDFDKHAELLKCLLDIWQESSTLDPDQQPSEHKEELKLEET